MTNGRKWTHRCDVHEINEDCHGDSNDMQDMLDKVHSLFYH